MLTQTYCFMLLFQTRSIWGSTVAIFKNSPISLLPMNSSFYYILDSSKSSHHFCSFYIRSSQLAAELLLICPSHKHLHFVFLHFVMFCDGFEYVLKVTQITSMLANISISRNSMPTVSKKTSSQICPKILQEFHW